MICEILSVGTELLLGDITDTNATFLSRRLREMGVMIYHRTTCGDNAARLSEAMQRALSRSDLVVVTGGLGPTYDDITREVASELLEMPLSLNDEVVERLQNFFRLRGREMTENNLRQAMVPEGGVVLQNDWGTAPGLWLEKKGKILVLLPGVPSEMKALFTHRVAPLLAQKIKGAFANRILHFYGIGESAADALLSDLMQKGKNPTIAPYAKSGEMELHVTAFADTAEKAEDMCRLAKGEILSRMGGYYYGEGKTSLEKEVVTLLKKKGLTIATAESCTGGLLSQRLTSVAGASAVLGFGLCAYSEETKRKVLGVPDEVLARDGVYSEACALAMAEGARTLSGSRIGVGITGLAGPDGGTRENPVGTVYIAVVTDDCKVVRRGFFGMQGAGREGIRHRAASFALAEILRIFGGLSALS